MQYYNIGDLNFFLLPSFSYYSFFQRVQSIFGEDAKNITYALFKNAGEDLGKSLREKQIMDPTTVLNELGWGKISVQMFPNEIKVVVFNPPHIKPFQDINYSEKVDNHLSGFFAGLFSALFEKGYDCYEAECFIENLKKCEFICRA